MVKPANSGPAKFAIPPHRQISPDTKPRHHAAEHQQRLDQQRLFDARDGDVRAIHSERRPDRALHLCAVLL